MSHCHEQQVAVDAAQADIANWMAEGDALFNTLHERMLALQACEAQHGPGPGPGGGDAQLLALNTVRASLKLYKVVGEWE